MCSTRFVYFVYSCLPRHGGVSKIISNLLRDKLVAHDNGRTAYEGYRLTFQGYDFLALRVLLNRGHITGVGEQVLNARLLRGFECSFDM